MDNHRRRYRPSKNPQGNEVLKRTEDRPSNGGASFGTVLEEDLDHLRGEMNDFPCLKALANDMGIDFDFDNH